MNLTITEAGMEDAMTIDFANELIEVVLTGCERGAGAWDISRMVLRWITADLTGLDLELDDLSDAELDQFVSANQSTFDTILAHFNEHAVAVFDLAKALYVADHAQVGQA